mgnify:CR=1 FL=1
MTSGILVCGVEFFKVFTVFQNCWEGRVLGPDSTSQPPGPGFESGLHNSDSEK